MGIPIESPDPIIPPNTIPADKICIPPILPRKPRLHERHGQLQWDVNFGKMWLYQIMDAACLSPHLTLLSDQAKDPVLAPFDNANPTPTDSSFPHANSASWDPIMTFEDDGLNQPFVANAPAPVKHPKSHASTLCVALAQQWNELIPHLIVPFLR
ncbi:hypothetical protein BS47DRAFT_1387509 [Hydnum rufescens UP504]|uniref:Uncharacterized protein n=1 Tax=Hydnum rufescens UP504 TaxID=1448309 RepID=A0A9P6B9T9_9AGAM|nr:hypothetical protein BS47DRAFT_1387509 [Hydnum rufescens UP504]